MRNKYTVYLIFVLFASSLKMFSVCIQYEECFFLIFLYFVMFHFSLKQIKLAEIIIFFIYCIYNKIIENLNLLSTMKMWNRKLNK